METWAGLSRGRSAEACSCAWAWLPSWRRSVVWSLLRVGARRGPLLEMQTGGTRRQAAVSYGGGVTGPLFDGRRGTGLLREGRIGHASGRGGEGTTIRKRTAAGNSCRWKHRRGPSWRGKRETCGGKQRFLWRREYGLSSGEGMGRRCCNQEARA